jgi:hypothetical protein
LKSQVSPNQHQAHLSHQKPDFYPHKPTVDVKVLPLFPRACESYSEPLAAAEQEALFASAGQYEPIFNPAHPTR